MHTQTLVPVPVDSDFSIYNLPFGIFSHPTATMPRPGTILGDRIINLLVLQRMGMLEGIHLGLAGALQAPALNPFIALGKTAWSGLRKRLQQLLTGQIKGFAYEDFLTANHDVKDCTLHMPVQVPNYTDFYSSEYHATNVGRMFRPDNPLMPNWKHMPIAYHGRASSIGVSPMQVKRPKGQIKPPDVEEPLFAPTRQMDYELEMAFIVGQSNELGEPVLIEHAEDHIFGMVVFNDWSARDIQAWEYQPLGPFLAKNFASTISPWIVTMEALEPFRTQSPTQQPEVLPYLKPHRGDMHLDVNMQVSIKAEGDPVYTCIGLSNHKHLYWSQAQQLAHHTVTGCNLQIGDMCASGTISGPTPDSLGCLLETTQRGKNPVSLQNGQSRGFLQNGDSVQMRAWAEKDEMRVGFGICEGTIIEN